MSHPSLRRIGSALASLMLVSFASGVPNLQAGEVLILNSNFDELAPAKSWSWEDWSLPASTVTYDATLNAAGGAAGSGSLRLSTPFDPTKTDWQQAVFTLDVDDFDASELQSVSLDVKVDPSSVLHTGTEYGSLRIILRDGSNWDWRQMLLIPLTSTSWQRVTAHLDQREGGGTINDIRAFTIQIVQNGAPGTTISLNVDNIAFNEEVIIDNFDDGNVDGWTATWGSAPELSYDTLDRYGRETSGSLRVAANYFDPGVTTWQQAVITVPFPETNAPLAFTHINVDVRVDPASLLNRDNDYGYFEIKTPSGGAISGAGVDLTGNEWAHLSFELRPSDGILNSVLFQLGSDSFTGPVIYNVDNFSWSRRFTPPPPPTLSLEPARPGLNLIHTSADQYGRHNIYSADSSALGFYNQADVASVSYSFTLAGFPSSAVAPGFQAHMFLVPNYSGSSTAPDWDVPTLLYLDVKAGADGSGDAVMRWKANQAGGNSQLYAGGLPNLHSASVLGTWTITASENTHFVITAPDGNSTTLDLTPEVAALFDGTIRVYVGVQGNSPNNIGRRAQLGGVEVSKLSAGQEVTVLLEDDFSGDVLDETKWVVNSTAGGVQMITEPGWLVIWTLPDTEFALQWATSLDKNATWTESTTIPIQLSPLKKQASIPQTELPDSPMIFWRMAAPQ